MSRHHRFLAKKSVGAPFRFLISPSFFPLQAQHFVWHYPSSAISGSLKGFYALSEMRLPG